MMCYGFSGGVHGVGEGWCKFWPYVMPIVRAHVAPGYSACGHPLNGWAAVNWDALFASYPIRNNGRGYAQGLRYGKRPAALLVYPVIEFHAVIISPGVSVCQ